MQLIGVLGGTFDPIHDGHLHLANEVLEKLKLDEVKLIPSNIPPHRPEPSASSEGRKKMVELAIYGKQNLSVDSREIRNKDISYTIDTLESLHKEFPKDALFLIIGEDVFKNINTWKSWESLLNYCHILVATRPDNKTDVLCEEIKKWKDDNRADDFNILRAVPSGYIYFIDIPIIEISSSMIRECYKINKPTNNYLASDIIDYIKINNLYK